MDYELCAEKIWEDLRAHNHRYGLPVCDVWADVDDDIRVAFVTAVTMESKDPSDSLEAFYYTHIAGILENNWGGTLTPANKRGYNLLSEPERRKVNIITNNVRTFKERFLG